MSDLFPGDRQPPLWRRVLGAAAMPFRALGLVATRLWNAARGRPNGDAP